MGVLNKNWIVLILAIGLSLSITDGDNNIRLPDQVPQQVNQVQPQVQYQQVQQQLTQPQPQPIPPQQIQPESRNRQGKHLLDFVGLGTGTNVDPYLAKINSLCLNGELAECFKSQALGTFTDFFSKPEYL